MFETPPKTIADLMTKKLLAVAPEDEIGHILERMTELRFAHLPVVEGKKLVGLVSEKDLLHASSSFLSAEATKRDELIGHTKVKTIMQTEVITAAPTDELAEIGRVMHESRIGCVPVVKDGELVGIVTEKDFVRLAVYLLATR